jgi:hypothetical protein
VAIYYALYADDSILADPDEGELNSIIERIRVIGLDITEEDELEDFWGINIGRIDENAYFTAPIDRSNPS